MYQVCVCLIALLELRLWLRNAGDREIYDSSVTAETLSHTQRCQPVINWIVLQARLPKAARRLCLSVSAKVLPMVLDTLLFPFPHFSISSFLISSFPIPAFRPTRCRCRAVWPWHGSTWSTSIRRRGTTPKNVLMLGYLAWTSALPLSTAEILRSIFSIQEHTTWMIVYTIVLSTTQIISLL